MDGALNLQRLADMKGAPPVDPAVAPDPSAVVPDPGANAPDPGAPPLDVSLVPPGAVSSAAMEAAQSANPEPDGDDAYEAPANDLYAQLAAADSPASAQAIVKQFMKDHAAGAREAALQHLPEIAKNMQAATDEWAKAAGGMFGKHPHLQKHGELMDLLTKEEYSKDPKATPDAMFGEVAKRANGMLNYSKGGPSLPADSAHGPGTSAVTPVVPANETLNDKRLREMRSSGGK